MTKIQSFQNSAGQPQILTSNRQLKAFLTLQYAAKYALSAQTQFYLKERSMMDLKKHRALGHAILGVAQQEGGKLIAQGILSDAATGQFSGDYPIEMSQQEHTGLIQCVSVHPEHQGRGLAMHIMQTLQESAMMRGHTMLVAKIAADNAPSLKAFAKFGMTPICHGRAAQGDQSYIFMHKPVMG